MKEVLDLLGKVTHQLQKERGCVALVLGNQIHGIEQSPANVRRLEDQACCTDKSLNTLQQAHQRWLTGKQYIAGEKLAYRFTSLQQLPQHRRTVLAGHCDVHQVIDFYTHELIAPLLEIMVEDALFDTRNDSKRVSAYGNFLQWKERVGRERALGSLHLSQQQPLEQFIHQLSLLVAEQTAYRKTFVALADQEQHSHLHQLDELQCMKEVHQLHEYLKKTAEK